MEMEVLLSTLMVISMDSWYNKMQEILLSKCWNVCRIEPSILRSGRHRKSNTISPCDQNACNRHLFKKLI